MVCLALLVNSGDGFGAGEFIAGGMHSFVTYAGVYSAQHVFDQVATVVYLADDTVGTVVLVQGHGASSPVGRAGVMVGFIFQYVQMIIKTQAGHNTARFVAGIFTA